MASVLETFYFLFESDASKLERGLDDANKKTTNLEKGLKGADAAGTAMGGTLMRLAGAAGAALGGMLAFGALKGAVLEVSDAVDTLGKKAAALNIPVEDLDAYSRVAKMAGGTSEDFGESLKRLNEQVVEMAATGKGPLAEFAKHVGLSLGDVKKGAKDPLFALGQISEKFKGLSRTEAAGLGVKLGLGPGTIAALSEGRDKLEALVEEQKRFGVTTAEQAEKAAKFNDTMDEWNAQFGTLKRELVTTALPPLVEFLKVLTRGVQWMNDHKGLVATFFGIIAAVLIGVYAPAAFTAAAATWAMLAPYLAVIGVVALVAAVVALIAEDLYNFGQGHDSLIGRAVEQWPALGSAIKGIGKVLAWLFAAAGSIMAGFMVLVTEGPVAAFDFLQESLKSVVDDILGEFPIIRDIMEGAFEGVRIAIEAVTAAWDWLMGKVDAGVKIWEKLISFSFFGGGSKGALFGETAAVNPGVDRASIERGSSIIAATRTPLASQTSNSIVNQGARSKTTTVNTGPITVQTQATDAQKVAADLGNAMASQFKGAIDDADDAVLA